MATHLQWHQKLNCSPSVALVDAHQKQFKPSHVVLLVLVLLAPVIPPGCPGRGHHPPSLPQACQAVLRVEQPLVVARSQRQVGASLSVASVQAAQGVPPGVLGGSLRSGLHSVELWLGHTLGQGRGRAGVQGLVTVRAEGGAVSISGTERRKSPGSVHHNGFRYLGRVEALSSAQKLEEGVSMAAGGSIPHPRIACAVPVLQLLQPCRHPQGVAGWVQDVGQEDGGSVELGRIVC